MAAHPPPWRLETLKNALTCALMWLLVFGVLWLNFKNDEAVKSFYPAISLRYSTPLSAEAAYGARRFAIHEANAKFWPTFWSEETAKLESELFNTNARCIYYSGKGGLVWPALFLSGSWPGATEESGCVVSNALAQRLWASDDVLGKPVKIDGKTFAVGGVFDSKEELALASVGDEGCPGGWQAVELEDISQTAATGADAKAFATSAGLGEADNLLDGSVIQFISATASWMVPAMLVLGMLGQWMVTRKKEKSLFTAGLVFVCLVAVALLLPQLLSLLPNWLIPGKWSDFSHWSSLAKQLADQSGLVAGYP